MRVKVNPKRKVVTEVIVHIVHGSVGPRQAATPVS
jgi:hypothetical protein